MNINILQYSHEAGPLRKYIEFIRSFYSDVYDPKLIEYYTKNVLRLLSDNNPFFKYAKIKNFLAWENKNVLGHISAIIDERLKKENIGILGFYDCVQNLSISNELLTRAIDYLKDSGCKKIIGPINLSIWHGYRFIDKMERSPTIFDPFNKPYYIDFWQRHGFKISERYVSAVRENFDYVITPTKEMHDLNIKRGFRIRSLDPKRLHSDLRIIHELSNKIFDQNKNFIRLSFDEFEYLYKDTLNKLEPSFVQIMENEEHIPAGFAFCLPNPFIPGQIILKTLGVLKEYRRQGIAATLIYSLHRKAKEEGFKEFYYPLIREASAVTKFSFKGYKLITHYVSLELK